MSRRIDRSTWGIDLNNPYNVPVVQGWENMYTMEPFETYYQRWPQALSNFPEAVVRQWVHRHWREFRTRWLHWDLAKITFTLATYTNAQIMAIDHIEPWIESMNANGDNLFVNRTIQSTWLATYMLEQGAAPVPILVAVGAGGLMHPDGKPMKSPLQLIEGHLRLTYLRGMIRNQHHALKPTHQVWNLTLPGPS